MSVPGSPADRLRELGIELPDATAPIASYCTWAQSGSLLFTSGHISRRAGAPVTGRLGAGLDTAAGAEAARWAAVELLSTIQSAVGLDAVRRVIRVVGYINSAPEFGEQSAVLNGASDLLLEVFGRSIGTHTRSAIGVASLPLGAAVEVDAILDVEHAR